MNTLTKGNSIEEYNAILDAALFLATLYETIQESVISDLMKWHNNGLLPWQALKMITGFSSSSTCNICKTKTQLSNDELISNCIYGRCHLNLSSDARMTSVDGYINDKRVPCTNHDTYCNILQAKTSSELISAIRQRAMFIRGILSCYKDNPPSIDVQIKETD